MKFWLSALFILMATLSSAMPVTAVKYEGLVHMSEAVADGMLGFETGDEVDEEQIDAALKRFFSQGYFDDIVVTEETGELTFVFTEKPIISRVEIEGYTTEDEAEKEQLLQIKKGSLYDEKRIEAAKKRIIEKISMEGKVDTIVETEVKTQENGSVALKFLVNEGEEIYIDSLVYDGVEGVEAGSFDAVIANKEREFMGWFWGRNDGKLQLSQLEYDPLRIRDYYMQFGYLDARVDAPFVRIDFDHYTANMSYQIFEGDVYRISDISFAQETSVIGEEKLAESVHLKRNEAFNIKTFREDAERIKTLIADMGYAYVQVVPDLKKDEEKDAVHVVYRIRPGNKVRIRNVVIAGNNRTLDRIVRRELYLGPGDMYNLTDLKDSRNALGRLGFFESSTVEEKRIDDRSMDLIVKVKEAPTGNIQVGGGYGSYGGLMMNVSVSDRNIFGSGINMGLTLERSQMTENYSFNISNSRLNDSDFSGNFSIFTSRYDYVTYAVDTEGMSVGVGHRLTRHLGAYLGYTYASNSYSDVNLTGITSNFYFFEDYAKSSVMLSFNFDNTDDYYVAREGFMATQSFEQAGLGGDADFFKSRTSFTAYRGLDPWLGFDLIARYKARLYYANDSGYLPIAERFFMGGIGSVRGYENYSLAPIQGDSSGYERRIGGTQTFSNNVELSFPLLPDAKMRLTAFYDWGWIEGETADHIGLYNIPVKGKTQSITRSSYGAAIEWLSPVGPLQLVFGYPIDEQPEDKVASFEFTIGQRF